MTLKIATWNVNSITSRKDRVLEFLSRERPDVLCLQELKCVEEAFPFEAIENAGYHASVFGQKTYNGVAILSKQPQKDVVKGFDDGDEDDSARMMAATIKGVRIVCVYVPNGQAVGSDKFAFKLAWYKRLRKWLDAHSSPDGKIIVTGDFNVAPAEIDVHEPDAWRGSVLFSKPEHDALRTLFHWGLVDVFRELHPDEPGLYSWWDYRALAFPKNNGLRIDLVLAPKAYAAKAQDARIDRQERKGEKPSDHAPVIVTFA